MYHSKLFKAFLLLLTALLLTMGAAGALGTAFFEDYGLYEQSYEQMAEKKLRILGQELAEYHCNLYNLEQTPEYENIAWWHGNVFYHPWINDEDYTVSFRVGEENIIRGNTKRPAESYAQVYNVTSTKVAFDDTNPGLGAGTYITYYDEKQQAQVTSWLSFQEGPQYNVSVTISTSALANRDEAYAFLELFHPYKKTVPWLMLAFLPVIPCVALLFKAAGKRKDGQNAPGGLNRLPLDLHLALSLLGIQALFYLIQRNWVYKGNYVLAAAVVVVILYFIALLLVNGLFVLFAQFKMGWRYAWRRSVVGFVLGKIWKALCFCGRGLRGLFRVLPLAWQWLAAAVAMAVIPLFFLALAWHAAPFFQLLFLLSIGADIAVVLYGAYCYGTLAKGAKEMSRGNLNHRIPGKHLAGCFEDFAMELNALGGTARNAAMEQMKSERMKTELITNVSHDIKTPLTSIINYVDLLQKPHTEEEQAEYLEVLSRQTGQMKRLLEDLLELSKASSGAISVSIMPVNLTETVHQALGEFSDKLEAARLTPVLRGGEKEILVAADGRLVWRVLSNLLSNAVKYSLPDTRLYLQIEERSNVIALSMKNISREELRVSAEELLERFVRGDASRSAEGSGLGLNIAKSLMQVQQGELELTVDGDLFKVTLLLPKLPE